MIPQIEDIYRQWRTQQEWIARVPKVFLCGCAKSGTTWLMNLLNGHPEVVVRGEGCFTYQLVPILSQAFGAFNKHQQGKDSITHLRDLDLIVTARSLIDSQLARYVRESGRDPSKVKLVGDKTPQHTISLNELGQLYPSARFIHIVRDPRDVATSAWFHFGKNDSRTFGQYIEYFITQAWPINVNGARQAAANLGGRYLELRYEDLLDREEELLEQTLKFLHVDASKPAVEACSKAGDFKKRSGGRSRGQSDEASFYRSGTSGDWQNHLPIDLVGKCCEKIAPLMQACGYDPSCDGVDESTAQARQRELRLQRKREEVLAPAASVFDF